ncbi:MAG: DUF3313 domain-containing protein [Halioglobus sp.]|nr:DUF3313 domain-containing protein [Halioglobus sp.]
MRTAKYARVGIAVASLLLAACETTPQIQTGEDAEVIAGSNLVRVDHSRAKLAYVDPQAPFGKYTAIMLAPLGVENVEIIQPGNSSRSYGNRNWELTDSDKQRLQADFQQAMAQQLSSTGNFQLVDSIGDRVLTISARLTRIAPTAPKDDNRSRPTGRSHIITEGSGRLSVEVIFSDSETGEVLALAKDTRSASSQWGLNNSVTNAAEVRRVFNSWARQIATQLERLHDKAGTPPAAEI